MIVKSVLALAALVLSAVAMPAAAQDADKAPSKTPEPTATMVANPDPENVLVLDLSTGGRVEILLRPDVAPNTVERIKTLTRRGFYDGIIFHRVIDGFMAQTGDPTGTGKGGSDLPDLKAEFNDLPHLRGTVSMARAAAEDSANSQFFIMLMPRLELDHKYTVFGRVYKGMDYVDLIAKGSPPANPSRVIQASILADNKAPPMPKFSTEPLPQNVPGRPGQPAAQGQQQGGDISVDQLNAPIGK